MEIITTVDKILFSLLLLIFVASFISSHKITQKYETKKKYWAKTLEKWEDLVYKAETLEQVIELRKLWEVEIIEKHEDYILYKCDVYHLRYFRELNGIILGKYSILKTQK